MDPLQLALIFLVCLLAALLTIMGFQVFLILRDLKKALDRFNRILESGDRFVEDIEKPMAMAGAAASVIETGVKVIEDLTRKPKVPQKPKFYRKVLR